MTNIGNDSRSKGSFARCWFQNRIDFAAGTCMEVGKIGGQVVTAVHYSIVRERIKGEVRVTGFYSVYSTEGEAGGGHYALTVNVAMGGYFYRCLITMCVGWRLGV